MALSLLSQLLKNAPSSTQQLGGSKVAAVSLGLRSPKKKSGRAPMGWTFSESQSLNTGTWNPDRT